MLIVYPPSMRHDEILIPSYYEDHLLERVSLLELRLSQMTERLSMTLDLMLKQAQTIEADHTMLQTVLETLQAFGITEKEKLVESLKSKRDKESAESKKRRRVEEILANHQTPNAQLFTHLVTEGVSLLEKTEEKQAFQMLERAALLSPENVSLLVFIAVNLFRADRFELATKNLEKARSLSPQRMEILLLLGAIYADERDGEKARRFLSFLASNPQTLIVSDYIWGMLAASEENWLEALAAFKTALESANLPELNYLTGCVYFQLNNFEKARQYLQNAVKIDVKFADAWFMLSLVEPDEQMAEDALQKALKAGEAGAQCIEFLKRRKQTEFKISLPFLHFKKNKMRLLSNGSPRLSKFFRELIFEVIE